MINNLLNVLEASKSVYHSGAVLENYLEKNDFHKLNLEEEFKLEVGKSYYIKKYGAIIALRVDSKNDGFSIVSSHTDSPTIKLKSNPEITSNGYNQLNTEVYGGPILNTWFDKPLSIAGIVQYLEDGVIKEELIDFKRPICVIPNLAIHMNREINNGVKIDKQKHLKPIMSLIESDTQQSFIEILAAQLQVDADKILSFDLNLYNVQPPMLFGLNNEFLLSPRLDNMSMALASIEGLIHSKGNKSIKIAACFEAEEIGSLTLNGGDSSFLGNILERIAVSLGMDREQYLISLEKSFGISADLAHSVHPNFSDKADETNKPLINKGFVIKKSSNRKYATDSFGEAKIIQLAKKADIDYQIFFNNSNEAGGTTIGPIMSAKLPIATIDIGNPILGMHSERETGGVYDYENIIKLLTAFYGE